MQMRMVCHVAWRQTVEHTMIPETWKAVALSASIMVENCPFVECLVVSDPPTAEPSV